MRPLPGFVGSAYGSRSTNYSSQRLVNMYIEPGKGKAPAMLVGTPGDVVASAAGSEESGAGIRAMAVLNEERAAIVSGTQLFIVGTSSTSLPTISIFYGLTDDRLPASIAFDGSNILVASGGTLFGITLTSPYGSTMSVVRGNVSSVDFIDGYFILADADSGRFYVSGQYSTTIDELDFATAEGAPDNLRRVVVHNREALLFGTSTVEVWYVTGNADFPMSRVQGAFIEEGLAAKDSAVSCGNTVCWLGASQDGGANVWMLNGYQPQLISTPAISFAISQWPTFSDAWAFFYKQEGHAFYVLSSPSGNETWCYDLSTGEWHQRASLNFETGELERLNYSTHMYFSGKNLAGYWRAKYSIVAPVVELQLDRYVDSISTLIPRIRRMPVYQEGLEILRNKSFQIDMDSGVGLDGGGTSVVSSYNGSSLTTVTAGANPVATLKYSKDGGNTWSPELSAPLGRIGEYGTRVRWNRVGGGRREVFEVKIAEPVKVCITGAYVD